MKILYLKSLIVVIAFIIVILKGNKTVAQNEFIKKFYTSDNGLANNTVQDICQDKTGFIWIATWDGLSRYDGNEFRSYYHKPNDSLSFPFFIAWKVIVDESNRVFVQCDQKPLVVYNRARDIFESLWNTQKNIKFYDTFLDLDGQIWSMDENYIYQFDKSLKIKKKIRHTGIFKNNDEKLYTHQITIDNKNTFWVIGDREVGNVIFKSEYINDSTLIFNDLKQFIPQNSKSSNLRIEFGEFNIQVSKKGETFLFTKFGLYNYDEQKNEFSLFHSIPNHNDFEKIPYLIWLTDSTGINVIDTKLNRFYQIPQEPNCFFETVFIDNSGIIWAGVVSENPDKVGLFKYVPVPGCFNHYLTAPNENGNRSIITAIFKDKFKNLWAGTHEKNFLIKIAPDGSEEKIILSRNSNDATQPIIRTIAGDPEGFWLGCTNDYLLKYDYKTKTLSPHFSGLKSLPDSVSPLKIHNLLFENQSLLINGDKGIYAYNEKSRFLENKFNLFPRGICHSFMPDKKGGYWLGTWGNSVKWLNSSFKIAGEFRIGNGENLVEHICVGDSSDLWLALMGGGLGHLYPETRKYEILTTSDGLANNSLYSILKDKNGNLWISTNKGISSFNPKTRQFRNYDKADGLMIEVFNYDSWFQSDDGEMFFGGDGGLVGFYPDSVLKLETMNYNLILMDLQVSGESRYLEKPVYESDTIRLRKGDNNFRATFACINFTNADRIKYRYRLSGENKNWVETDYRNRIVNYTNLTHKKYNLEIEATNRQGEWAYHKSVWVIIPHKFHETNLFRVSLILLIFGLSMLTIQLYVNQVRLKEKQKQEELKLESLRGQMNPHFLFNALNSINYFISNNDKLSANYYIADFSRLIRTFLNNLSQEYVSLDTELQLLEDYLKLEHLRFSDKFDFELVTDNIEDPAAWKVYPGMIQPFIENAIWHGVRNLENRKGIIKVTFDFVNPEQMRCNVEDDGVGRNNPILLKSKLPGKKSRGISIVNDRLRIYNNLKKKDFKVIIEDAFPEKPETGTRVIIDVPVKKEVG